MWWQEVADLPPVEFPRAIQLAQNALQVSLEQHNALLIAKAKFTRARLSHHTNDSLDSGALITDAMREFARLGYLRSSTTLISATLNSSPTSRAARSRAASLLSHLMLHGGRYDEARDLLERQVTARSDEVRPGASAFVSLALGQVSFAMFAADVTS